MSEPITWEPKKVKIADLKENPKNPKILTSDGVKRLHKSIDKFGPAGVLIINTDYSIIDGHSRKKELEAEGVDEVWASMPSRLLTDEEYKEMNAIYDHARAGEVDRFMIENLFDDEMLTEWDFKKAKKDKDGVKELFPIVPKYDEKHDAIIILVETNNESAYIRNALMLDVEMSYKNKNTGQSFVTTGKKFIQAWTQKSK